MAFSIERMFSSPELNGKVPSNIRFAPDGSCVTYLAQGNEQHNAADLWRYDLRSGQNEMLLAAATFETTRGLSDEDKAARERRRVFGHGIIDYHWSPLCDSLLIPAAGNLYLYPLARKEDGLTQLTDESTYETDAHYSPDGQWISFVREKNLFIVPADLDLATTTAPRRLTSDGGGDVTNGIAEFIAQEEMHRFKGYWWAPDASRIAYIQTDESTIAVSQRYEIDAEDFRVFDQRYPYAGTSNAAVRLGVVTINDGQTRWLGLPETGEVYIARVDWLPDGRRLAVQAQSRDQQILRLYLYDLGTDAPPHLILEEQSDTWVSLHDDLRFLKSSDRVVWASERTGHKHLYLYDIKGRPLGPLTEGEWSVAALKALDEDRNRVYFEAFYKHPTEKHLYWQNLDEPLAEPVAVTETPGWHDTVVHPGARRLVDRLAAPTHPAHISLRGLDEAIEPVPLGDNRVLPGHPFHPFLDALPEVTIGSLDAADGQALHFRLSVAPGLDRQRSHPAVVIVYGGPGVQRVRLEWPALWTTYLTQQGYVVFELDNRGSANRGRQFEAPIYRHMGDIEVTDQLRGVDYLAGLPYVDPDRIGVFGHSYGGYMVLMLLMKSAAFRAGVAIAPVTDWRLYDTHYSERYLGHPDENSAGYAASAVFPYLGALEDPLLLMHGMADDNVLFTHTTKLMKALQSANKRFDLMTYPGSKHGLAERDVSIHRFTAIAEFLARHLQPDGSN